MVCEIIQRAPTLLVQTTYMNSTTDDSSIHWLQARLSKWANTVTEEKLCLELFVEGRSIFKINQRACMCTYKPSPWTQTTGMRA